MWIWCTLFCIFFLQMVSIYSDDLASLEDFISQVKSTKDKKIRRLQKKKRYLLISIDNRDLTRIYHDKHYASMTAVITQAYADYHHYDYLYLQNNVTCLEALIKRKYPQAIPDGAIDAKAVAKDIVTAFHVGLQQYRAASWAKLPVLWYINHLYAGEYEYIWYIDSDATVNPFHMTRNIDDALDDWMREKKDSVREDEAEEGKRKHPIAWNSHYPPSQAPLHYHNPSNLSLNHIKYGQRDLKKSHFIFFNNFPWRDNMPCAGSFLFKPTAYADEVFRQWWDFNLPTKTFKHFHEQDALWYMIQAEFWLEMRDLLIKHKRRQSLQKGDLKEMIGNGGGIEGIPSYYHEFPGKMTFPWKETIDWLEQTEGKVNFLLNSTTYSIVDEIQFPSSDYVRYEDLWLVHIASYNYAMRMPILYQFLRKINVDSPDKFSIRIQSIQQKHTMLLNPLTMCEDMEILSQKDVSELGKTRVSVFPLHNERLQSEWYDEHVTSRLSHLTSKVVPMKKMYEGRLIRFKHEFWLVENGLRRGFDNFNLFVGLSLVDDLAIPIRRQEVDLIPIGNIIKAGSLSNEERKYLLRYFEVQSPTKLPYIASNLSTPSTAISIQPTSSTTASSCGMDVELERLVHTKGTTALLLIISHSEESDHLVRDFIHCHQLLYRKQQLSQISKEKEIENYWMHSLSIPSTVFFESIMYGVLYDNNSLPITSLSARNSGANGWKKSLTLASYITHDLERYDYIITATYKTITKQLQYNSFTQSLSMITSYLTLAAHEDYDAVPFLRSGSEMMEFVTYFHGKPFCLAWYRLLSLLGYPDAVVHKFDKEKKVFYRNIYIMKSKVFFKLSQLMQKAMKISLESEEIRALLAVDSKYKEGNEEVAKRIFGTAYYQLHPFVFERLPSFFLYAMNAKICTGATGPCKYNS